MKTLEELKAEGEAPEWMQPASLATLRGSYLLPDETPKGMWRRAAESSAMHLGKPEMADKFFDIMWRGFLCLATPIASNSGTLRGLPISCFGNHPADSTSSILDKAHELAMLSKFGGGVGINLSEIRPAGTAISSGGKTEGVVPFAKIYDSVVAGISQGNVRRGAAAVYLRADHGDFEEFLKIRKPEGDPNRQCLNLHQGAVISDAFMTAALSGAPKESELLAKIYKSRLETGEPYCMFVDNVNRNRPAAYKNNGLNVTFSNLCSEIFLYTDPEHSFVCCLSSMNLARWEEWKDTDAIYLATWFLEGVLNEFIEKATDRPGFAPAVASAVKGRALGLGVLGWHTLLQSEMTPMDSFRATLLNRAIFQKMQQETERASKDMAAEFGEPEWCKGTGLRHSHRTAVAPTASNSIISGNVSPGIEPINSNAYTKRTAKGVFLEYNPTLKSLLASKGKDTEAVWKQILADEGSVRSLSFLTPEQKEVFKTAFEIDQRTLVQLAADRQKYICQGQSLNLFFSSKVEPQYFHEVHVQAWEKGLGTLYYVRSSSVLKADLASRGDECVACEA